MNSIASEAARPQSIEPPSRLLQLLEGRVLWELGATLSLWPLLRLAPKGDGHPVLVLPGLIGSDLSTGLLRRFLRERGYRAHGWKLGANLGLKPGVEEKLFARLDELHTRYGRKVSVIGWSLGGLYARALGVHRPDAVRSVITLGSPFAGPPKATNAWRVYEWASGQRADDPAAQARVSGHLTMPSTSIYSRSDGIVAWPCSVDEPSDRSENIEVVASHLGLGVHPAVLYAIADRLAQPEGQWKPFDRAGARGLGRGLIYPEPARA
jgi:pimeloyl-ACP methyl ester carboxylesterase